MKKYIKPVSEVIQTEVICGNFIQATIMNGNDYKTVVGTIPVYEDQDPNNKKNGDDDAWGTGIWGGD